MILGRNIERSRGHVTYKNDNSAFLTFGVTPFVMSDSDYPLISFLLSKSKSLWNISMILVGNVEQNQKMCCVQE